MKTLKAKSSLSNLVTHMCLQMGPLFEHGKAHTWLNDPIKFLYNIIVAEEPFANCTVKPGEYRPFGATN